VTAQQLRRLAEQAAYAHDFFRPTNPAVARRFRDAAEVASALADQLAEEEHLAALRLDVANLKADLGPSAA
jgi:hypothetical protein